MAGTIFARELAPAHARRVEFARATAADDADLRRLLRENPMAGQISLSLEREPDFFAAFCGAEQQTIVAREGGRLACAGWCVFRKRFVNGTPRRVGYLGGLRLDRRFAGRFDLVRRGYEFFHELQRERPAEFYFTSIAADNDRARRLLERGLPGLPRYTPLAEFVTVLLPVPTGGCRSCTPAHVATGGGEWTAVVSQLAGHNHREQLAPNWSAAELSSLARHGLAAADVCSVNVAGETAFAALWDQRGFKQTIVRGYRRALRLARPLLNAAARLLGRPGLPRVGEPLAHAFVSQLSVTPENSAALRALVAELFVRAGARGVAFLTLGFDARDPRLATVRRHFRGHEYRSRLYAVGWDDLPSLRLDDGLCAPEVALL